ncbi:MAG: hypothetical protein WKG32_00360 [Gemmatimonadaceae bacterium]
MTSAARAAFATLSAVAAPLLACVHAAPPVTTAPTTAWITSLTSAHQAAADGRFGAADTALATFAAAYAGTAEAKEAAFWRAIYALDPANAASQFGNVVRHLDEYLRDSVPGIHTPEAKALRAMASSLDSLTRVVRSAQEAVEQAPVEPPRATTSPKEEELQKEVLRLKEALEKSNAELERIKRRLTGPVRPPA